MREGRRARVLVSRVPSRETTPPRRSHKTGPPLLRSPRVEAPRLPSRKTEPPLPLSHRTEAPLLLSRRPEAPLLPSASVLQVRPRRGAANQFGLYYMAAPL